MKFVNDLCSNYLTVPYEGEEQEFSLRMMAENITENFLALTLRRLDEETFLYYNISGLQSMELFYAERPIDRSAFQTLMRQLQEAIEESRELFLAGDGICLEPAALFWDLETERWKFIYIPGQEQKGNGQIQREREKLAEFLVMRMDYEDKELTESVYRFYEEICAGKVSPGNFAKKIEPEQVWEKEPDEYRKQEETEETLLEEEAVFPVWEREEEPDEAEEKTPHGNKKLQLLLCVLLCVSVAVTLTIGKIIPAVAMPGIAMSVMLAAALFGTLLKRRKKEETIEYTADDILYTEPEESFYEAEEEKEQNIEKTVYMDLGRTQERKLYGIGKCRRQKIFLEKLPCLVGKDKKLVNHIINDASVSRMHAKFFAEKETLWMQDLNSTNGTYHNGMRLSPNEKVILEPEDEIAFGRAQFIFR